MERLYVSYFIEKSTDVSTQADEVKKDRLDQRMKVWADVIVEDRYQKKEQRVARIA